MKNLLFRTGLFFLFIGQYLLCSADGYKDEILRLSKIDGLSRFQDAVVKQISSYDTTGGNDDGFSGKYSYLRKENGSLVIADLQGPGVIQRIWTPTPTKDTIQFFFDGEDTPRLELKFIDLFTGEKFPFLRPVVGNEVGGYYCYLPVPYQKSCKVVFKGKLLQFIQIQYRELKGNQTVSTFPKALSTEEQEALASVVKMWKNSGKTIENLVPSVMENIKIITKRLMLKPGDMGYIFSMPNGGRIIGLEITPLVPMNNELKDLILRARWDDEAVPAINCPLSDFFGYAYGKPSMQSMLMGVSNGIHYCYLPMPFDQKAVIELEYIKNEANKYAEIPVDIKVYFSEDKRMTDEGKLYAEWKREPKTEAGKPYLILKKSGRGHHVGTILQAQGLNSGMTIFFEGDDKCTVDGQLRLHGTGSEDYFNGGWYALADRWDQAFSLPMHGCMAYSVPLARTAGYRFLMTDKLSFENDIQLSIEHGPQNNNIPGDYTSVAFYYCDTPPESNELPKVELLTKINTPHLLEYWLQLLPINAMGKGSVISYEDQKDAKSGKDFEVFRLTAPEGGFAKFALEVPSEGEYQLYLSYFKGPDGCPFEVNQRQIPLKHLDGYAAENTLVEKESIGTLYIKEGTNTITVTLMNGPQKSGNNTLALHRLYLEKVNR